MQTEIFVKRSRMPAAAQAVFDWHLRPGAFQRLAPPWEPVEVIDAGGEIREGSRVSFRVPMGPFQKTWIAEHRDFIAGRQFRDVQIAGPFARWEHTHSVEPDGPDACFLEDRIEYALPLGSAGQLLGGAFVRNKLERTFAYRHRITAQDIGLQRLHQGVVPMKILISGSTGLVGTALIPLLTTAGHDVIRLVRSKAKSAAREMVHWDPEANYIDAAGLEGLDAVVHLAGEGIASGRWTDAKKRRIRDSRVEGTRLLCETLAHASRPPKVLVNASAIGYYGDRGDEIVTEQSQPGTGFLPDVCKAWEAATEPARQKGIRIVFTRLGIVLSQAGGALAQMLTPFKMGAGGVLGSGTQFMSWVALDDVLGAILYALNNESLHGPLNLVAPNPVTNREFTRALGSVLHRPTVLPMPAFAARLAFGEMADALLLSSTRVIPKRLQEAGYAFQYPELESALRHVLGK